MLTNLRLVDMTGKELLELLHQANPMSDKQKIVTEQPKVHPDIPPLVTGIKDAARVQSHAGKNRERLTIVSTKVERL